MIEINSLDIKLFVGSAISEMFDTMLSMEVELSDADLQKPLKGNRIVGSVGFAGAVMGSINIQVNDVFARIMTAAMLGVKVDEIDGDEEIYDVIGEMSNMVGGDLKSRLCDSGFPCQLSIPSIMSGTDYKIESFKWSRYERLAFRYEQHAILVEVYIKSGS